ncbi:MAG: hypothetical protein ACLR8P_13260 [Clostridium fessum]
MRHWDSMWRRHIYGCLQGFVTFGIALAGYVTGAILYVFQVPYATLALTGLELLTG